MQTAHFLANQKSAAADQNRIEESSEYAADQLNDIELQAIAGGAATVNVV